MASSTGRRAMSRIVKRLIVSRSARRCSRRMLFTLSRAGMPDRSITTGMSFCGRRASSAFVKSRLMFSEKSRSSRSSSFSAVSPGLRSISRRQEETFSRKMSARRKHERPRYAEMCEQHFPLLPVQDLIAGEKRQPDVPQRKPLHPGAVCLRLQRHERCARRNDGVAQLRGNAVTVAGGAGRRIR